MANYDHFGIILYDYVYLCIITCSFRIQKFIVFGNASIKQTSATSVPRGEPNSWLGTVALGETEYDMKRQ